MKKEILLFIVMSLIAVVISAGIYCLNLLIPPKKIIKEKYCICDSIGIQEDVTITVYNPTVKQCDDTPLVTADNTIINPLHPKRMVGLSRDLLNKYKYNTCICLTIPEAPYLKR